MRGLYYFGRAQICSAKWLSDLDIAAEGGRDFLKNYYFNGVVMIIEREAPAAALLDLLDALPDTTQGGNPFEVHLYVTSLGMGYKGSHVRYQRQAETGHYYWQEQTISGYPWDNTCDGKAPQDPVCRYSPTHCRFCPPEDFRDPCLERPRRRCRRDPCCPDSSECAVDPGATCCSDWSELAGLSRAMFEQLKPGMRRPGSSVDNGDRVRGWVVNAELEFLINSCGLTSRCVSWPGGRPADVRLRARQWTQELRALTGGRALAFGSDGSAIQPIREREFLRAVSRASGRGAVRLFPLPPNIVDGVDQAPVASEARAIGRRYSCQGFRLMPFGTGKEVGSWSGGVDAADPSDNSSIDAWVTPRVVKSCSAADGCVLAMGSPSSYEWFTEGDHKSLWTDAKAALKAGWDEFPSGNKP